VKKKEKESNLSSWKLEKNFVIISIFETTGHYEIFKKLKKKGMYKRNLDIHAFSRTVVV
jgi:hypothetical protein